MVRPRTRTKNIVLCALFIALITVGAYIRIPTPLIPITLQFFMTIMAGMLLGDKLGALSVLLYIVLGLIGVPVFATGGGIGYIFRPSFGYMIGFVIGAFVCGRMTAAAGGQKFGRLFVAALVDTAVVYTCGTVYCWLINAYYLNEAIGFWPLILSCILTPLPKDLLLCLLAAYLGKRLIPLVRNRAV